MTAITREWRAGVELLRVEGGIRKDLSVPVKTRAAGQVAMRDWNWRSNA
jgi:hypothetical protein